MRVPRLLPLIAVAVGGVVALRAVGVAPELFQGAKAWAEEVSAPASAQTGTPQSRPAPAACAISAADLARQAGLSPAELRLIQNLKARRGELDARDTDFATQLPLLLAAEQKLDGKIATMNGLKAELQAMLGQANTRQQEEVNRLVQVYTAMRPREAARVMAQLDDSVRLPVAAAMRPRSLAAVMAQMEPAQARVLTEKLARRFESTNLAQRAAEASAPVAPGAAPTAAPTPQPAAATPVPPPADAANAPAAAPRPRPQRAAARPPRRPAPRPAASAPARQAASTSPGPQPYAGQTANVPAPASANAQPAAPRQSVQ